MHSRKNISFTFSAGLVFFISIGVFNEKPLLTARQLEKNIAKVNDSLYAYRYETSNAEYNAFLASLVTRDPALYDKCVIDSTAWNQILMYCDPMVNYYHKHPGFAKYPVVNVSYEGAAKYCEWLTELYNNDPKRKFRKILFTLPSTTEWVEAAQGGRKNALFPWGNYYLRNKKGMYLCNIKHIDESQVVSDSLGKPVLSGTGRSQYAGGLNDRAAYYTAPVHSFFPNDFGIYNTSGNVAEMMSEEGITKGGSWNNFGGEATITSKKVYNSPSPEVGFRVFMKVLEP